MIVIRLMGGLGNQMFQYAFGHYLELKYATELKYDLFLLNQRKNIGDWVVRNYDLDIFGIHRAAASLKEVRSMKERTGILRVDSLLNKWIGEKKTYLLEKDLHFSSTYFNAPDHIYLEGYFASEKYFAPIKEKIKKEFTVVEPLMPDAEKLMEEIRQCKSVCVNIRRGDFVTNPTHNICNENYYYEAEKLLLSKEKDFRFYVFSDDIEWCQNHLKFSVPTVFVTHHYKGKKFQDYFRLMSACHHFIIPNSTFAWWAAYLNEINDKIVIAPNRWLNLPGFSVKDILPENWIKLPV